MSLKVVLDTNCLVSGDKDILVFGESHPKENIISPAHFIEILAIDFRLNS